MVMPGVHQETRVFLVFDSNCCGERLPRGVVRSRKGPLGDRDAPGYKTAQGLQTKVLATNQQTSGFNGNRMFSAHQGRGSSQRSWACPNKRSNRLCASCSPEAKTLKRDETRTGVIEQQPDLLPTMVIALPVEASCSYILQ